MKTSIRVALVVGVLAAFVTMTAVMAHKASNNNPERFVSETEADAMVSQYPGLAKLVEAGYKPLVVSENKARDERVVIFRVCGKMVRQQCLTYRPTLESPVVVFTTTQSGLDDQLQFSGKFLVNLGQPVNIEVNNPEAYELRCTVTDMLPTAETSTPIPVPAVSQIAEVATYLGNQSYAPSPADTRYQWFGSKVLWQCTAARI